MVSEGCEEGRNGGLTAFTSARPLLLLTDFSPEAQGGGAVILKSLLSPRDCERIVWATLSPVRERSEYRVVSLASARGRSLARDATIRTRALSRAIQTMMRSHGAQAAWIVAHGAPVRIAPSLISRGIPVHITVHDDPVWGYAILTRRYLGLAPLLAKDLRRSLLGARSADVVSSAMAERYREQHFAELSIVHRGLLGPVEPAPRYGDQRVLSVAVLGSTYGLGELRILAEALKMVQERLEIETRLSVIGGVNEGSVRRACSSSVALEVTGHLDERQGIRKLQSSFLLYMSYPFGRRGRVLRTTSFPTKLSTYVMAARPLLLHMPSESSVAFLGATSPYATLWRSSDAEEGAEIIEQLWHNERMAQSFHGEADDVRQQHYDLHRNRASLFRPLNALAER